MFKLSRRPEGPEKDTADVYLSLSFGVSCGGSELHKSLQAGQGTNMVIRRQHLRYNVRNERSSHRRCGRCS